uniref:Myc n=1 Tax=Polyandrocarpa misakiensis TaxID=7723 RepID=G1UJY3_POLMI|nr:Myc [Polyandrocarpa misakiensis]
MTRRFCENRVMSEYHSMKPYFINGNDDMYAACNHNAAPCDEMWKKFELYLTPPNSPPRENEDPAPQLVPACSDPQSTMDFDNFDDFDLGLKDFADDVMNFHDDVSLYETKTLACPGDQKLIKDCMWNGVGHKASAALRKAHNRTVSPHSRSPCHPNGCVDPRNIFPYPVGQPTQCERKKTLPSLTAATQKTFRPIVDGAETPSDSEEEIDVVTVEKSQTNNVLKPRNGLSNSPAKVIAHLVPKGGKLSLVTANGTSLATKGLIKTLAQNNEAERGRARNKFQVFAAAATPRVTKLQKSANTENKLVQNSLKRRHTADDNIKMQLANPKLLMQRGGDSTSPVARYDKKRILSLEGVSFCATTGVRQINQTPTKVETVEIQNEVPKFKIAEAIKELKPKEESNMATLVPTRPQGAKSSPSKKKRKAEALARLMSSGSGSDSEQIRAAHNVLERQRREGLRTSFHTLRDNIPELQRQEKTPKVNILNKARDYCMELQSMEKDLQAEKERLNRRHKKLLERLERAKSLPMHHESDLESDVDDVTSGDSPLLSPPTPNTYAPAGYYIARRVSNDSTTNTRDVLLRLEHPDATQPPKVVPIKQSNPDIGKSYKISNFRCALSPADALSDGFEYLDSEEELVTVTY